MESFYCIQYQLHWEIKQEAGRTQHEELNFFVNESIFGKENTAKVH